MGLTPKLHEKTMDAIAAALKDLKPRPAVDRILTARTSGEYVHYCQILLTYAPGSHGIAYVNLHNFKVKVHGPETKPGRFITAKEEKRLKKAEKVLTRNAAKEVKTVIFDPKLSTLGADDKITKGIKKTGKA